MDSARTTSAPRRQRTPRGRGFDLLELSRSGASRAVILQKVAEVARLMGHADTRTAVLLHGQDGFLSHASNDGMGDDFVAQVQAIPVSRSGPSCARAAATGDEVFTCDVALDPDWAPYAELTARLDIRACWSFPIKAGGRVLGTIAVYHRQPRAPGALEVDAYRYLASVASTVLAQQPA